MDTDFPSLPAELDERERQVSDDYDWCLRDPGLREKYPRMVVAVHKRTVWGVGKTHGEATRDALAKPGCPSREWLAKVYIDGSPSPAREQPGDESCGVGESGVEDEDFWPEGALDTDFPSLPAELDERERQVSDDYDWCLRDPGLREKYPRMVVAVHKRTVWGVGKTHGEATRDALAKPGCPSREWLAKVYIDGSPSPAREQPGDEPL